MIDNAIFYKPLSLERFKNLFQEIEGPIPTMDGELNIVMARHDNILAESTSETFREWYSNYRMVPNPNERVRYLLFCDTETHRLNGNIVSIAMILCDLKERKIIDKVYQLLNPLCPMDPEAESVHKISDEMVKNCPTFEDFYETVEKFFERSDMFVAFNAIYDLSVIIREFNRIGKLPKVLPHLDLMKRLKDEVRAKNSEGRLKNPTLDEASNYFSIKKDSEKLHDALYDTEVMMKTFFAAMDKIDSE